MRSLHAHKQAYWLSGFVLAAILLLVISAIAQPARADGGGFPTATRTPRPTRTPTVTPSLIPAATFASGGGLPFAPTNTFTPVANTINQAQPAIGVEGGTGTTAEESKFSFLSCWPFALVFLIVAVAGIWWLSSRIRNEMTP